MAAVNDGGVKIVKVYVEGKSVKMYIESEIYTGEVYEHKTPVVEGEDMRTTVENYLETIDMLPTWSWSGRVGQFAHKRNHKCSEGFKYKG